MGHALHDIGAMLADLRWSIGPVLLLFAAHQLASAGALTLCVAPRRALGFFNAFWIRLCGEAVEFLTCTGPIVAEPTKAWLLQRCGLDLAEGLAATLTEYLASTVAAAITAVAGTGYVLTVLEPPGPVRVAALSVLISMAVFIGLVASAVAARRPILTPIVRVLRRRPVPRLQATEDALIRTARETPGRLAGVMCAELAAQGFLALELWVLVAALRLPASPARAALMEGVMKFLNAGASFVPGQVGVAEGSYAAIFTVFGLPAMAGVTISIARRFRTLVTAVAGAILLIAARVRAARTPLTCPWRPPPHTASRSCPDT
jgi:Lysylphosphatidylglycerol synthase TM region